MNDRLRAAFEKSRFSRDIFHPRETKLECPFFVEFQEVRLACHYHQVESAKYTVIFFHGNGETVSDYEKKLPGIFEAFGCSSLLAEYRGYGMSDGQATLLNLIEDAPYLIKALALPEQKLILFGRSTGCLPAIHAASLFPNAHALVLQSGRADLATQLDDKWPLDSITEKDLRHCLGFYFDHKAKLAAFRGSTVVTHCIYDELVPVQNARELYSWANEPKLLELFPRGTHNSIFIANLSRYAEIFRHLNA